MKLELNFEKFLRFFLLLLICIVCAVPFVGMFNYDGAVYPYVTGKHFLFRSIVFIAAAIWLAILPFFSEVRPRGSWLIASLILFLVVVLIADLNGENFLGSFWSNYSRMEGFFSLLMYFVFFLILGSVMAERPGRWKIYWTAHVVASVFIFLIAVLQKLQIAEPVDPNRVDSVFGNSSYLAIYASMMFFICVNQFFTSANSTIFLWRWFFVFAAFCNLGSIYLSQTRSATLGVWLSSVFFVLMIVKNRKRAVIGLSLAFAVFCICIVLFKSSNGTSTNLFQRIAQISLKDGSVQARLEIWKYCLRAISDRPWLGWGQENFSHLAPYYEPLLSATPWVDRSHNLFLEWLVNAGILGLMALVIVLWVAIRYLWWATDLVLPKPQKVALLSCLLCWFVNQFFSIDFLSISILFYSLLAQAQNVSPSAVNEKLGIIKRFRWIAAAFSLCTLIPISIWASYYLHVRGFITNAELRQAGQLDQIMEESQSKPYRTLVEKLLRQYNVFEDWDIRRLLIQNSFYVHQRVRSDASLHPFGHYYYNLTNEQIQLQLAKTPNDLFFKHLAATFYMHYQVFDKAEELFEELVSKVPRQQYFLIDHGHLKMSTGKKAAALVLYKRAYDLDPNFDFARLYLAIGYLYNGRINEADEVANSLAQENKPEAFDERLINAYVANSQIEKANELVRNRKKKTEKDSMLMKGENR